MIVHVVRHADAGSRERWAGDDTRRPLSDQGRIEAKAVAEAFPGRLAGPLLSSPYLRCMQTLEPLAARLLTRVESEPLLAEGAPPEPLVARLSSLPDGSVLCSHGDVITNLIGHLAAGGATLDLVDTAKAAIWTLEMADGRVRAGVYTPPPRI